MDPVSGLKDRVEIYNIPSTFKEISQQQRKLTIIIEFNGDFKHEHPAVVQDNLAEIEEFARVRPVEAKASDIELKHVL